MATTTFSGSITPTINAYHIVGTVATSGVYIYKVDLSAMADGDEVELRFADKLTAGTISCAYSVGYSGRQATQIKISPPVVLGSTNPGGHVSIKQAAGTGRNFPFEVISI